MGNLAKKLRRMSLLLQRVRVVSRSYDLDIVRNQFPFLSFTLDATSAPLTLIDAPVESRCTAE